jgi:hypothetical protein
LAPCSSLVVGFMLLEEIIAVDLKSHKIRITALCGRSTEFISVLKQVAHILTTGIVKRKKATGSDVKSPLNVEDAACQSG